MNWDSYFTDGDKPYSENLNDSLVLTDAFDISVPVEMPTMFSNGEFNSSLNVTRKCNVGLVTLKSVDNGVTIGTDSISGTGSVVFRVYPNFNCFYKWDKILLEKSGTVDISFRKVDGTEITASVGSDGVISDNNALKQLQEIDVVFTLSSATINNILIWFVNNQGIRNRTGARLEASQLVNVNGTVNANDDKAVNGGTVKTALDSLHTVVTGEIEDLSDSVTGDLSTLNNRVTNEVNTLSNSINSVSTDVQTKYKQLISLMPCMVLTWNGNKFRLGRGTPFIANGAIIVDWGDGSDLQLTSNPVAHDFIDGADTHTVRIYGNITQIRERVFKNTDGLTSITIPDSVTTIGYLNFSECSSLTSVILPDSVTTIGYACFTECTVLTSIKLSNSLTSIDYNSFYLLTSLTSITIPDSVTSIGTSCFRRVPSAIILKWNNSTKIIPYADFINEELVHSSLKFYIPIGTTSAYIAKGYPSDKLQE